MLHPERGRLNFYAANHFASITMAQLRRGNFRRHHRINVVVIGCEGWLRQMHFFAQQSADFLGNIQHAQAIGTIWR